MYTVYNTRIFDLSTFCLVRINITLICRASETVVHKENDESYLPPKSGSGFKNQLLGVVQNLYCKGPGDTVLDLYTPSFLTLP